MRPTGRALRRRFGEPAVRSLLRVLISLGVTPLVLTSASARASVSVAVPLDALARASTLVVVATPLDQSSLWEAGRIVTYTRARIDRRVAGDASAIPIGSEQDRGGELWVRTLGGEVGRIGQVVDGEAVLTVGKPCLLFLRPAMLLSGNGAAPETSPAMSRVFSVAARAQGQFPVVLDGEASARLRTSSGVGATLPPHGTSVAPSPLASAALGGRTLDEATTTVAAAWSRTHAR